MSKLPSVLSVLDLPEAELCAARLDGELFSIDRCFCPIDEIDSMVNRAQSLRASFPDRLIAEQRSAAWIIGASALPPTHHQLCTRIESRVRPTNSPVSATIREVVIDEGDLAEVAGLTFTTPIRTAVDIARFSVGFDHDEYELVSALMRIGGFGVPECAVLLDSRRNLPGKRVALRRLIESQDYCATGSAGAARFLTSRR